MPGEKKQNTKPQDERATRVNSSYLGSRRSAALAVLEFSGRASVSVCLPRGAGSEKAVEMHRLWTREGRRGPCGASGRGSQGGPGRPGSDT